MGGHHLRFTSLSLKEGRHRTLTLDARLLQHLASQGWLMFQNVPGGGITVSKLEEELGVPKADVQLSLQNLHRLGCVVDEYQPTWDELGSSSIGIRVLNDKATFRPSPLGFSLLAACNIDGRGKTSAA